MTVFSIIKDSRRDCIFAFCAAALIHRLSIYSKTNFLSFFFISFLLRFFTRILHAETEMEMETEMRILRHNLRVGQILTLIILSWIPFLSLLLLLQVSPILIR